MRELPAGSVRSATGNTAIRTMGVDERAEVVRQIVVKGEGGGIVRLEDIASVRESFEDVDIRARLNGKPAVSLTVYKTGDEDAVNMATVVKAYVTGRNAEPFEPTLIETALLNLRGLGDPEQWAAAPPVTERMRAWQLGLSRPPAPGTMVTTTDLARFITGRLDLLSRNAAFGFVLVLATLLLLLNYRVAFWVAIGLAVSVLGTLAAMELVGITLNLLTMFGLIIVLGLLVDDAIVVAENIVARHEAGEPSREAAVTGTGQVTWPVLSTVLTTMCAFLPLALIAGQIGDLLGALPFVVTVSLAVSLIESLFILPSHMAHSLAEADKARDNARPGVFSRLNSALERHREALFQRVLIPTYATVLRVALRHRYISLAIAVATLSVSLGMVGGGRVSFTFFPSADSETMSVDLRMPVGTPLDETDAAIRIIEHALTDADRFPEVTAAFTSVGSAGSIEGTSSTTSTNLAQMILELAPVEERQAVGGRPSAEIRAELNRIGQTIVGAESFRVEEVSGGPSGPDLSLAVVGPSGDAVARASDRVKLALAQFEGVIGVSDDNESGRRELRFNLKDAARELDLSVADIATQVRGWVFGLEAHTFAGDREDVDVRVLLNEDARRSLAALESMFVFTPRGEPVPLVEVVEIEETRGYATIRRLDRNRVISVNADVDPAVTSAETIVGDLRPLLREIESEMPGVRVLERGRLQEMGDSLASLPLGMAVAAGLIYVILAWLFGSFFQPVAVMAAIPFAIIGMVWGHFLLGYDITILSLIGFVALSGVVVNDSLILMEFYNLERRRGRSEFDSAIAAGRARLRAILLTTVTTVLGLLPLMLEQSFQAKFLIPMAITISCGLISATVLILIVLPCLLVIGRDIRMVLRLLWTGSAAESDAREVVFSETP